MAPYPASLFKIIVAFRIMRLVDLGQLSLDQTYTYHPVAVVRGPRASSSTSPLERPIGRRTGLGDGRRGRPLRPRVRPGPSGTGWTR